MRKLLLVAALAMLPGCGMLESRDAFVAEGAVTTVLTLASAHPVVAIPVAAYTVYRAQRWDGLTRNEKRAHVVFGAVGVGVAAHAAAQGVWHGGDGGFTVSQ